MGASTLLRFSEKSPTSACLLSTRRSLLDGWHEGRERGLGVSRNCFDLAVSGETSKAGGCTNTTTMTKPVECRRRSTNVAEDSDVSRGRVHHEASALDHVRLAPFFLLRVLSALAVLADNGLVPALDHPILPHICYFPDS